MPLDESKFDDDAVATAAAAVPRHSVSRSSSSSSSSSKHRRGKGKGKGKRSKSKRAAVAAAVDAEEKQSGDDVETNGDLSPDGLTRAEEDLFASYTTFCASDKFMSKYLRIIVEWSFKFSSSRLGDGKARRQYSHEMREIFDSYVEEYERHLEFFLEREGFSPVSFFRILRAKKSGFVRGGQEDIKGEKREREERLCQVSTHTRLYTHSHSHSLSLTHTHTASRSWQDRNMVDSTFSCSCSSYIPSLYTRGDE